MTKEAPKQRIRVPAVSVRTSDSFQNFEARLGIGTDNMLSASTYGFNPVTRNRVLLEWMYRGSWLCGQAVDVVGDDMTREGIIMNGGLPPDDLEEIAAGMSDLAVWESLNEVVKWSRLYGGAIAVHLIDGQDLATPLRPETVAKGQYKGLFVLDRWMVQPSLADLVSDFGPDLGLPKFYDITADAPALRGKRVHYSRCIRLVGVDLPYWQRMTENLWGISVIERLYDRLVMFDSTTTGAAQLVYKAHLRTMKVEDLRKVLAMGGQALEGLVKQMDFIRKYQSTEGLTLLDAKDEFAAFNYTFSGLSDVLLQFGQQISGALQIPLVRLFGQSPAGLNSTGESDLRTYYDGVKNAQETRLRRGLEVTLDLVARSQIGKETPKKFGFEFRPLWQLTDMQKAEVARGTTDAVLAAEEGGVISRATALKELRQASTTTGVFGSITDEEIAEAEKDPPPAGELIGDPPLLALDPALADPQTKGAQLVPEPISNP